MGKNPTWDYPPSPVLLRERQPAAWSFGAKGAPERVRRGIGWYPIPLVILARLAVDLDDQRRGLALSLLQDAIRRAIAVAEHAGMRAILTHPLDAEAEAFYRRFGFESVPQNERYLVLSLKDARRVVMGATAGK